MTLHKLTAGDGYTYLTRQVAAQDVTHRGFDGLSDYYAERGESPGVWMGRGLALMPELADPASGGPLAVARPGGPVSETQMRALFGHGHHPDAELIATHWLAAGHGAPAAAAAARLGQPFPVFDGESEYRIRTAATFALWNTERGLPGDWPVPAEERSRIRSEIGRAMFTEQYDRPPADARELSGFVARASRQATTAVAGYDLTFSPVKSVSALWALAPRDIAQVIEQAHQDAVADVLSWLEDHAVYTRCGHNSVQQIEARGVLAAAFTHRDSRAGDPDLHTHVAISNKVQALDGRWLALDGRPLHKFTVAASERYNTRLEALLVARLGVVFTERPAAGGGKRPVREIVGLDAGLLARWSARRRMIEVRRAQLSSQFQREHGRTPTAVEAIALAQQANLETRQAKHEPRSLAEQRATWRAEAHAQLGGPRGVARMLRDTLHPRPIEDAPTVTPGWINTQARAMLGTVQADRAVWQEAHVRAEAERVARAQNVPLSRLDGTVDTLVATALGPRRSIPLGLPDPVTEPAELRRRDGTSVYSTVGTQLYTSREILAAEARLVAVARRRGGHQVDASAIELALLESVANGVELNPGQVALVRELGGSGARLQLALAPAGTGKTTAMRVLTRAWTSPAADGRRGTVIGLAPSAAAAAVLRAEIDPNPDAKHGKRATGRRTQAGPHTDTLAKLLDATGEFYGRTGWLPDWITAIGPRTLVVIDEAGMAGTVELARAVDFLIGRGALVRLIGDDQQLAAVGAGGVLRDIAHTVGAVALSQVVRFTNPKWGQAEAAASLALRAGDPAALGFYLDRGRVHVGDLATATEQAYQAWTADRDAGWDAVMLAPTLEIVAQLNTRARADRLAGDRPTDTEATDSGVRPGTKTGRGHVQPECGQERREVALSDGTRASAGDVIITRRNVRTLAITQTDWVKNGDRFEVEAVRLNGALQVRHLATGRHLTLPSKYVARSVTLGYASTVHTAQGITADVSHLVATGDEARQLLYVGLTRGREQNHVWLAVAGDGDPHSVITRDALLPPTGTDILARILARDGSPVSATSAQRDATDPAVRLAAATARYYDALLTAATHRLGPQRLAAIDTAANVTLGGLTAQPAYPSLRGLLALLALDGADPTTMLTQARDQRELGTALDPAAVLMWRLDPDRQPTHHPPATRGAVTNSVPSDSEDGGGGRVAPLPWLPSIPAALAGDAQWGPYLVSVQGWVIALAEQVRDQTLRWTPTKAPDWATGLLTDDTAASHAELHRIPARGGLLSDLAVWRAALGLSPDEASPTGPPQHLAAEVRYQRRLAERVTAVLGDPTAPARRWQPLAERIEPRLTEDPYWPRLATNLDAAARAGIDIAALLTRVAARAPLPDEHAAAALWWRTLQHLAPGVLRADTSTSATTLQPAWTPALADVLGSSAADRVQADPAWPALVAAVTDAAAQGWQPAQLLAAAHALHPPTGEPGHGSLRADELATALVWRIGTLTDPPPEGDQYPPIPDPRRGADITPADWAELPAPSDLERLGSIDVSSDDAWLDSLRPPDDGVDPPDSFAPVGHSGAAVADNITDSSALSVVDKLDAVLAVDRRALLPATRPEPPLTGASAESVTGASRQRLFELNALAMDYYAARYRHSWAPDYVHARLGSDLTGDARFPVGYAPPGWTHLTDHLRRHGATDEELVAAGLAGRSSTGRLYDVFRDRLILPVRTGPAAVDPPSPQRPSTDSGSVDPAVVGGIVAFIGRRNPATDGEPTAGPKYLNTRTTELYTKGQHVYGLAEVRGDRAAGAQVVLVEGPFDAIAVTLAGHGQFVGAAPLGTSLTDTHAVHLVRAARGGTTPGVIVATDADAAGRTAAAGDYWRLTALGDLPRHAALPDRLDPAELLQTHGPAALLTTLASAGSLADLLIAERIDQWADRLEFPEGRIGALRAAAQVIAALPPEQWIDHVRAVTDRLGTNPALGQLEVLDAAYTWIADPVGLAHRRISELRRAIPGPSANEAAAAAEADEPVGPAGTGQPASRELVSQAGVAGTRSPTRSRPARAADPQRTPPARGPRR